METRKLSYPVIDELKRKEFKSVIIFGASNPAELKDRGNTRLLASKELVTGERVTEKSFHVSIDDPVLEEICRHGEIQIDIP